MFEFYLQLPEGTPAAGAFVTYIKGYYHGDLGQLNAEWGTAYVSFEDIAGPALQRCPLVPCTGGFCQPGGLRWRQPITDVTQKWPAPSIRITSSWAFAIEVFLDRDLFITLSPLFDVNSINDYNRYGHLKPIFAEFYQATGKPMMVTEFSLPASRIPAICQTCSSMSIGRNIVAPAITSTCNRRPERRHGWHALVYVDGLCGGYGREWRLSLSTRPQCGPVSNDESMIYEALVRWVMRANQEVEAVHRGALGTERLEPAPAQMTVKRFTPSWMEIWRNGRKTRLSALPR